MEKLPSWVWIAGGAFVVLLLLTAKSNASTTGVTASAPVPAPDTSALDLATTQGKYGLATTLVNAAASLDIYNSQGRSQAEHDAAVLGALDRSNAGAVAAINAQGYADATNNTIGAQRDIAVTSIGASRDVSTASIGANRDYAVAGVQSRTAVDLANNATQQAVINANRDTTLAHDANATAVSVASINADADARRAALEAQAVADSNRTADAANARAASVASHQSDNGVIGTIASGLAAVGVALFGGLI